MKTRTCGILTALLLVAALLAPTSAASSQHRSGHRAGTAYVLSYLKGHYFGPKPGTHNMRAYVKYTYTWHYKSGAKYYTFSAAAQRDPLTPVAASSQRRFCWNPFDSNCLDWNWPRVWDDITGGDTLMNKLAACAKGAVSGVIGNMNRGTFVTSFYWAQSIDLSETFLLRSNPVGAAVGAVGGCTFYMWLDQ